jgi:hypothetical protein
LGFLQLGLERVPLGDDDGILCRRGAAQAGLDVAAKGGAFSGSRAR